MDFGKTPIRIIYRSRLYRKHSVTLEPGASVSTIFKALFTSEDFKKGLAGIVKSALETSEVSDKFRKLLIQEGVEIKEEISEREYEHLLKLVIKRVLNI